MYSALVGGFPSGAVDGGKWKVESGKRKAESRKRWLVIPTEEKSAFGTTRHDRSVRDGRRDDDLL